MNKHDFFRFQYHWLPTALAFLLVLFFALPGVIQADQSQPVEGISNKNPGADLWRQVRQRDSVVTGSSQVKGVDSQVLINARGEQWARFRKDSLISYGLKAVGAVLAVILLFFLIRGRVKIAGGLSGNMVHRFSSYDRVLHWVLALIFLFLAITGLLLLFGRSLLIPLFGHEFFSILASSSKEGHNLFGPIFIVPLVLMFIRFVKQNIYARGDLTWLLKGGGMIGKSHASGGFFNMGEKSWYWLVILVGVTISISGLILVSPIFGQSREVMELSHVVHSIGALILILVSFGHMYLGSIGTEGTSEGMKTGYVDIKWAEAHHDRWARQCHDENKIMAAEDYAKILGQSSEALQQSSLSMERNK